MASEPLIPIIKGDLLDAEEDFLCHQTNTTSTGAKGVARSIFKRFPYANTYLRRTRLVQGMIGIFELTGGEGERKIININAQIHPGGPKPSGMDSRQKRLEYFSSCLKQMARSLPPGSSYAFPYMIGCGYGGGNWDEYLPLLEEFARSPNVGRVVFYSIQ
jgi:O-acetyl-ADP-ribose deacetylase (regulator of RNase III)